METTGKPRSEKAVLALSSLLMWIPCLLLLLAGAPLWIGALLGLSAGTMTIQAAGTMQAAGGTGGTGRFSRRSARAFRS